MNVRGTPRVRMVAPRIRARLDRDEVVAPLGIRERPPRAGEVRVERGRMIVDRMRISAASVALPDLDERVRNGTAAIVQHAARDDDALAQRFCGVLPREIVIGVADWKKSIDRRSQIRKMVGNGDQRLEGRTPDRRSIWRIQELRLRGLSLRAAEVAHGGSGRAAVFSGPLFCRVLVPYGHQCQGTRSSTTNATVAGSASSYTSRFRRSAGPARSV